MGALDSAPFDIEAGRYESIMLSPTPCTSQDQRVAILRRVLDW